MRSHKRAEARSLIASVGARALFAFMLIAILGGGALASAINFRSAGSNEPRTEQGLNVATTQLGSNGDFSHLAERALPLRAVLVAPREASDMAANVPVQTAERRGLPGVTHTVRYTSGGASGSVTGAPPRRPRLTADQLNRLETARLRNLSSVGADV